MSNSNKKSTTYKKVYPFLLLFATLFMGIGYAAVNSITGNILGNATALANDGVFIETADLIAHENVSEESCNVNLSSKTTLSTSIDLGNNVNAYCTFEVTIRNNTTDRYMYTGDFTDNEFYLDQNGAYNEDIVYEITGITENYVLDVGLTTTLQIKFKYKSSDTSQNTLNSYVNFSFKKMYSVTYDNIEGNYQNYALDGENFIVNFSDKNYDELSVKMNGEEYNNFTYENKILTINNVTGNIVITYIENETPPPSSGIPEGKDFEIEIMEQGGVHYYVFSLTNITTTDSTGWTVYLAVPPDAEVTNSYNCVVNHDKVNNILMISNAPWNGVIKAGEKQYNVFGITFTSADTDYYPSEFTGLIT